MGESTSKDIITREEIERTFLIRSREIYIAKYMEAMMQDKLLTRTKLKGKNVSEEEKKLLAVSGDQMDTFNELVTICDELLK